MSPLEYTLALASLISLEDNTIEDSDSTDQAIIEFEGGTL